MGRKLIITNNEEKEIHLSCSNQKPHFFSGTHSSNSKFCRRNLYVSRRSVSEILRKQVEFHVTTKIHFAKATVLRPNW